jgi:hypothetical protein
MLRGISEPNITHGGHHRPVCAPQKGVVRMASRRGGRGRGCYRRRLRPRQTQGRRRQLLDDGDLERKQVGRTPGCAWWRRATLCMPRWQGISIGCPSVRSRSLDAVLVVRFMPGRLRNTTTEPTVTATVEAPRSLKHWDRGAFVLARTGLVATDWQHPGEVVLVRTGVYWPCRSLWWPCSVHIGS